MDLEKIYREAGALLDGHFLLSSGNHSNRYLQTAKLLENPKISEKIATELAKKIKNKNLEIHTICSPALGGILAGYELSRSLECRSIFAERKDNKMLLRRGFSIKKGEKILICEDIITTGGSAMEVYKVLEDLGAEIVGFASFANRGFCKIIDSKLEVQKECKLKKDIPFFSLSNFEFLIFRPENCPLCKKNIKLIKPGSRIN